jgi:hypothetical protein
VKRIHAVVTETEVVAAIPVATVSESNQREHWAVKNRRKKMQCAMVKLWLARALHRPPFAPPYLVTLTRMYQPDLLPGKRGARKQDPGNFEGSFKHVQDEIARLLKVDDGDASKVSWLYDQQPGPEIGITVRIEQRTRERIQAESVRLCGVR